jgi:hypothetical protein
MGFVFNAWANCQQTQHKPLYCVSSKRATFCRRRGPLSLSRLMVVSATLLKLVADLRVSQHVV